MLKRSLYASSIAAILLVALWGVGRAEGSCATHGDLSAVSLRIPSFYSEADFPTLRVSAPTGEVVTEPGQGSGESKAPESGESIGTGTMSESDPGKDFPNFGTTRPLDDLLGIHNGPDYMGPVREDDGS